MDTQEEITVAEEISFVTGLGRLLARMSLDRELYIDYVTDEEAVIAKVGLSNQEARALLDKDWDRILRLLGPQIPHSGMASGGGVRDPNDLVGSTLPRKESQSGEGPGCVEDRAAPLTAWTAARKGKGSA